MSSPQAGPDWQQIHADLAQAVETLPPLETCDLASTAVQRWIAATQRAIEESLVGSMSLDSSHFAAAARRLGLSLMRENAAHEMRTHLFAALARAESKPGVKPAASSASAHTLDGLTGLATRGAFDSALATLTSSATAATPLALVFGDVDKFKSINDQHSHAKGDAVLQEVARRLQAVCQGKGEVFRYGGEEIVLLLPNFDLAEALATAERSRLAIADQPCAGLSVTASFGVSTFPGLAPTHDVLCDTADKAMYDAKHRGRNLVRFYGEPEPRKADESSRPVRKAPEPGGLTESHLATFRSLHFQHKAVSCPRDRAYMRTVESEPIDGPVKVFASCPQCGFSCEF